jgi:hypothetical protein
VVNGVRDRGRRADDADLTAALDAERVDVQILRAIKLLGTEVAPVVREEVARRTARTAAA